MKHLQKFNEYKLEDPMNLGEDIAKDLATQGFRLIAIAYKNISANKKIYKTEDESDLVLLGFLGFLVLGFLVLRGSGDG